MKSKLFTCAVGTALGLSLAGGTAHANVTAITMPDSSANTVVTFDPYNGSVMNNSFIDLNPLNAGTPQHATTVGDEVWVTDQIRDRIDRFSLDGQTHLGQIGGQVPGGGLDNIRGLAWDGDNTVYVANAGTDWGAPGQAVVTIDVSSNSVSGNFGLPDNDSPWFPEIVGDSLFVSTISDHRIQEFDLAGNHEGLVYQGDPDGNMRFIQQIHHNDAGNFYAAGFSGLGPATAGLYEISPDGDELLQIPQSGVRGIWELGNGNILWSDGSGAHVYDLITGMNTTVYEGTGRMFGELSVVPTPGALAVLAMAGLVGTRRRR
jgi:MYXO-CTERM domain-containing protein